MSLAQPHESADGHQCVNESAAGYIRPYITNQPEGFVAAIDEFFAVERAAGSRCGYVSHAVVVGGTYTMVDRRIVGASKGSGYGVKHERYASPSRGVGLIQLSKHRARVEQSSA